MIGATEIDLTYVIGVVGLIGAATGAVAVFRKSGKESAAILVDASTDVVLIQKGVIEELRAGLAAAQDEIAKLQGYRTEADLLRFRVRELEDRVAHLEAENTELRETLNGR